MRPLCHFIAIMVLAGLHLLQPALAQVYQCADANGRKMFSQTPCSALGGTGEKKLVTAPARAPGVADGNMPTGKPPKDWAAENAAANARAGAQNAASPQGAWPVPGGSRGGTASGGKSDQQIVSDCEASHGARCNSSGEIAQRRMEQRTLSSEERQQQQSAIAERKQRQLEESFNRR
jgi:Domain of unknown function (DUF4124)